MNQLCLFCTFYFESGRPWSPLAPLLGEDRHMRPLTFFAQNWFHNNKTIRRTVGSASVIITIELKCVFLYGVIFDLFGFTLFIEDSYSQLCECVSHVERYMSSSQPHTNETRLKSSDVSFICELLKWTSLLWWINEALHVLKMKYFIHWTIH